MKTLPTIATAVLLSIAGTAALVTAGPLTPPAGPVASTYKTLTEVEPGITVNASNCPGDATSVFRITQPGSYYLTSNLAGAPGKTTVVIAAERVTLDLNGFVVSATGGLSAIKGGSNYATVRNGTVQGGAEKAVDLATAGFSRVEDLTVRGGTVGIQVYFSSTVRGCRVIDVSGSGTTGVGIIAGVNGQVLDCQTDSTPSRGIWAGVSCVVDRCVVRGSSGPAALQAGANSVVRACTVTQGSSINGIQTDLGATVSGCVVREAAYGFSIGPASTVEGCQATGCDMDGFAGGEKSVFRGCSANLSGQHGFDLLAAASLEQCAASESGQDGFHAIGASNFTRCTATLNSANGFQGGDSTVLTDCVAGTNSGRGFSLGSFATLRACTAENNTGQGIRVGDACRVEGCTARMNGRGTSTAGIWIVGSGGNIADNQMYGNGFGLWVDGSQNVIVRNTTRANINTAYTFAASNDAAPIVSSPGTNNFGTMTPWSNIEN